MTEIEKLQKENEILKSQLDTIANIDKESKYKQALEAIKTICEQPSLKNDYTAINVLMVLKDYKISEDL